jgi:hypothetical protein
MSKIPTMTDIFEVYFASTLQQADAELSLIHFQGFVLGQQIVD